MYYIPGAQKNVYLKEVSTLVKAIRKSGGIDPIAGAPDLNAVRNLLLDWVSSVLGDAGPESVARMIKLEVRHAQAAETPVAAAPAGASGGLEVPPSAPAQDVAPGVRVSTFRVLVAPPAGPFVLSSDADCVAAVERETDLAARLAAGASFVAGRHQVFITGSTPYPGSRALYHCVAVTHG